jgi:hypothetical protein
MKYLGLFFAGWLFSASATWGQVGQIPAYIQPPPASASYQGPGDITFNGSAANVKEFCELCPRGQ